MRWIQTTYKAHFLCTITLIYLIQSLRSFAWMGISYEVNETLRLYQVLISTTFFPWSVKPLFGIIVSEQNRGKIHLAYLVVSSILYFLPWVALAQTPSGASFIYLVVLLTTQNISATDVVDVTVAEASETNRINPAQDLRPISWFAIALGGILGSLCNGLGLGLANFSIEGVFLLLAIFPILQQFECGSLGEKTICQVTKAIDEGNYDDQREVLSVEEPPIDVDYFGMLNSFSEEDDYLDTINMLQVFVKERQFSGGIAIVRLPRNIDHDEGVREQVLKEKKRRIHDDEDWIQIGQHRIENHEIVSETNYSPDLEEDVQEIFTSDVNDLMEELEMDEIESLTKQSNAQAQAIAGHPEASQWPQRKFNKNWWQELKSTLLDIVKHPAIIQYFYIALQATRGPVLWIVITQLVIPSVCSILLCCNYKTDASLQVELSGASAMISWGGLMLSTFIFNHYLKHIPVRKVAL